VIAIEPVRKELRVNASQAHAFAVFTRDMSRWWPPTHSILKSPQKECIIEPRIGGRWYAVGEDGSTCQTGYVIDWNPPHSLILAWQLNPAWAYDPTLITEVEVRFIVENANLTRVELEHRHLERMGAAALATRNAIDSPGGWSEIMESFRKFTVSSAGATS
jgi:Activator of Hsp90 ATPase homolog 1-like protein